MIFASSVRWHNSETEARHPVFNLLSNVGVQTRSRSVIVTTQHRGRQCPDPLVQHRYCAYQECFQWRLSDWEPCFIEVQQPLTATLTTSRPIYLLFYPSWAPASWFRLNIPCGEKFFCFPFHILILLARWRRRYASSFPAVLNVNRG